MVEKSVKDRWLFPAIPAAVSPGSAADPLSCLVATSPLLGLGAAQPCPSFFFSRPLESVDWLKTKTKNKESRNQSDKDTLTLFQKSLMPSIVTG